MNEVTERELEYLKTADGKIPFQEWFDDLKDIQAQVIIRNRLVRVKAGNLGNIRSLSEGVQELKIDYGPGYRVYFAELGNTIIVLIAGGTKRTQENDIKKAVALWKEAKK